MDLRESKVKVKTKKYSKLVKVKAVKSHNLGIYRRGWTSTLGSIMRKFKQHHHPSAI